MTKFVDSHVQKLLLQAEKRLNVNVTVPENKKIGKSVEKLRAEQHISSTPSPVLSSEVKSVRAPDTESKAQSVNQDTAGSSWFNLPKTDMTPDFKRDWQLLRMRGVLDPKHHKKALRSGPPKYSQLGEIIEGPTDPRRARLTRKERKGTILEHMMVDHDDLKLKSKFADIQKVKTSGKKAFYRKVVSERRKRRG